MQAQIAREMQRASRSLGVLATVGASAPFIGLFGTVWGIMNAFTNIAQQQQTNLAVVAPGIAEALFATALGLVAAIPAVIFYNKFTGDLDRFGDRLDTFSDEVAARLSRRLGERT
jgi:biopolymer transport protein TolQ